MAEESVGLTITADIEDAERALEKLNALTQELAKNVDAFSKAPNNTAGFDRLIDKIVQIDRYQQKVMKETNQNIASRTMRGGEDKEKIKELQAEKKRLELQYTNLKYRVRPAMDRRKQYTGLDVAPMAPSKSYRKDTPQHERVNQAATDELADIRAKRDATKRLMNTARNARILNAGQAATLENNLKYFTDEKTVNAERERTVDSRAKVRTEHVEAQEQLIKQRQEFKDMKAQYDAAKIVNEGKHVNDPGYMPAPTKEELMRQDRLVKENSEKVSIMTDTLKKLDDRLKEIDRAQNIFGEAKSEVEQINSEGRGIQVVGDRTKVRGMLYERASATALAAVAASLYRMKTITQSGQQVYDSIVTQSQQIGQSMGGDADFRAIRQDVLGAGISGGNMDAQTSMEMASLITSNAGTRSQETLNALVTELGRGQRAIPVEQAIMDDYMGTLLRTGAIDGQAGDVESIQKAFVGAVKASGMEGREQEQIELMAEMSKILFEGRKGSPAEIENRTALATLLNRTGNESVMGQAGAALMSSIDQAIKGTDPFSNHSIIMGAGQDPKYQGAAGMLQMKRDKEEGLTTDVLNRYLAAAQARGGNEDVQKWNLSLLLDGLNVETTTDQLDAIFAAAGPDKKITDEELKNILGEIKDDGEASYNERTGRYNKSGDAIRDEKDANLAKRNMMTQDNALSDFNNKWKAAWGRLGASSPTMAAVTAGLEGVGALISGILTSVVWGSVASFTRKILTTKFMGTAAGTSLAGKLGGGGTLGKVGTWLAGHGVDIGGVAAKATEATSPIAGAGEAVAGAGEAVAGGAGAGAGAGAGGAAVGTGAAATLKGMGASALAGANSLAAGFLANPATLLIGGAVLGATHIARAEDKQKAGTEVVGGAVGAVAGGLGAKLALAGSAFGPLGTIIGGAIGLAVGGKIGGKVYDAVKESGAGDWMREKWENTKNFFKGETASASELTEDEKDKLNSNEYTTTASTAEEQATATSKQATEKLRSVTTKEEKDNLTYFESLLAETRQLLAIAKAQNGFMGVSSDILSGQGSGVGGGLSYLTGAEGYWSDTNLQNHDLAKTVNTLTADQLDKWIGSKAKPGSVMLGMGEAFMEAGRQSGLDPRYLVAHAAHETGWGTSNIAKDKGNMYGIGAFDASPYASAYGYNNAQAGIIEGAKWIKDNYYNAGQSTLHTMRNNGGVHEYATDPEWASKIANTMVGSEKYTKPSMNVTNNITVTSSGNADADAQKISRAVNRGITKMHTQEVRLIT